MLEKIMDLQILLYSMAALGALGAIGMLTTNLIEAYCSSNHPMDYYRRERTDL